MLADDCKVPIEKLAWKCDPEIFEFETTEDLPDLEDTIGQERAIRSVDFGLSMVENGFNLYLAGETGTGRTSSIMNILKKRAKTEPPPLDWCYVYNFKTPDHPLNLSLKVGMGRELDEDMKELVQSVKNDIPKALQSKEYELDKNKIVTENQEKNNQLFSVMEKECEENGYALQRTVSGLVVVPQKGQ
jgi:Cdc6-like AAA superfamily ATPase